MTKLINVSFSESDAARMCRLKHHLAYTERWRTEDTPAALSRGTALHAVMEYHYDVLRKHGENSLPVDASTLAAIREKAIEKELLHGDGADDAVAWMYEGYADFYGCDNAWEVLAVEIEFEVPLYDRTGAVSEFQLIGRIDLIVRNRGTGKVFVVDHKTCSNLPTEKALDFDEQMALYTIAGRRLGYEIHGAVYNAIRSKKLVRAMTPEERFSRKIVTKTEYELSVVEHELVDTMRSIHSQPKEFDPPRSPDSDRCNWKCNFREACIAGRKMGPERMREFLRDTGFKRPEGAASLPLPMAIPAQAGSQLDLVLEIAAAEARQPASEPEPQPALPTVDGDWERCWEQVDGAWCSMWRLAVKRPPTLLSIALGGSR